MSVFPFNHSYIVFFDNLKHICNPKWDVLIVKVNHNQCQFCIAWKFIGESQSFCCLLWKYAIPSLAAYPPEFDIVLDYPHISQISWCLNYLFTVSSIGVMDGIINTGGFYNQSGLCYFGAYGCTYHCILPANQCEQHPL